MITELRSLRGVTFYILAAAFTFGIGTLWINSLWPFAVFQAVIVLSACTWLGIAAFRPDLRVSPWLALPFAVALWGMGQLVRGRSENLWQTRQSVFAWVTHGCVAVLAYQVCRDRRWRAISLRVFAITAGALALLSTVQNYAAPGRVLWLFDSGYADGVFGPFVYHTKLANFAELGIPVALWLALNERRARGVYVAAAIVLAAAVVASASRGGTVVVGLEFLTVGFIAARGHLKGRAIQTGLAFTGALLAGLMVCGWDLAFDRFQQNDPLRDLRLPIARTSVDMAQQYWLTGSGLGTWNSVYPGFARFDIHAFVNQAHCDWLQWLVEGGILFPAIMLGMAALAIRAARREWWTLGVVFVWLHGAWDYPMQQTLALASLQVAFWGAAMAVRESLGRPQPPTTAVGAYVRTQ